MKKRHHPLYFTHQGMISRCKYPSQVHWSRYGGRGISVCDRWQGPNGLWNFIEDMGDKPSSDLTLHRVNNDGNYEPDNCVWATPEEQANCTSANRILTINGEEATMAQWARRMGMSIQTLASRVGKLGMDEHLAVTTPVGAVHRDELKGRWSRKYDACIECGTTEKKYASKGRCHACNMAWRYREYGDPRKKKSS